MSNPFPYKAKDYVDQFFPNQETFSVDDMRLAYSAGAKVGNSKTMSCWIPVNRPPTPKANRSVFVLCFSSTFGIELKKVLSSECPQFIENHPEALYWCYEDRIVPKRVRQELLELKQETDI